MNVGMIGVGLMGHGIALNVVKSGHGLRFLEHPGNQPVDDIIELGARKVSSVAEVVTEAEVVILCLTGTPQVRSVMLDSRGILEILKPDQIVVDCSTAIPSATRDIAARVGEVGAYFVDAAMTRTPLEAEQGRLNLIVGASDELFQRVRSLLDCFAEVITHAGATGAGHEMKLIHNFVSLGFTGILCEAAAYARRAGVAPKTFVEVIGKGGGGGVVFDRLVPFINDSNPGNFRFSIANALKDLGYYRQMVADADAPELTAAVIHELYADAADAGHGERPVPELIEILEHQEEF